MTDRSTAITAPLGRWSSRIALFAASLMVIGVVLHRLTSFPTPVALNLFLVSAAGSGLAMLVALVAFIQIWRRGYKGAGSAAVGFLLPLLILAWPLSFLPAFLNQPPLNDISTDLATPPRFVELAKTRIAGMNPAAYPAERFASVQQKAHPDLRTFTVDRSVEETFELIEDAVRKLKWSVAVAEAPVARSAKGGRLEATDHTMLVGFIDDIVVRVEGNATRSRVDVRSASRYGIHDFGQNATRVRHFLIELQTRVDSTAPATVAGRRSHRAGALVKRLKERDQKKAESRKKQDRAQSNAQRGPAPKEKQR
jgi:hypothetical protein